MIRLDLKEDLIKDCCNIYMFLSRYEQCLPRRFKRIARRSINKDFRKGLRKINRKAPVFIELPKLKSEGNGMYSEQYKKETTKEIIVASDLSEPSID